MDVSVGPGMVSTGLVTLVAGEVCTVTFADNIGAVEIISDGAADIWYTTDGGAPTIGGQKSWRLPAGALVVDQRETFRLSSKRNTVALISSGAPVVTIQRA